MKKSTLFVFFIFLSCFQLAAQRFLEPVFEDVTVTADITYGVNATVLLVSQFNEAVPQPLELDFYEPTGDDSESRPLVILLHTGNFLPPLVNGGCTGSKKDATVVDIATRLAKMGYVVAAANYRLGWNPLAEPQTARVFGIINAAYRGVQDSRTVIRYFNKTVEEGNPYNIDPNRIVMWGVGTGGYVSLASATLDTITDTYITKFTTPAGPMVNEVINGDVNGETFGVVPPGVTYPFPANDTLNYPNHVGYSSEFHLAVNLGGALGDLSWIDENDVPTISFHVPSDPYAPCETGIVLVPVQNLSVVEVSGSCAAQPVFVSTGTNAAIDAGGPYDDAVSVEARTKNGGIESLYLFETEEIDDSAPWQYTSSLMPYGMPGSPDPCNTDAVEAGLYLDTIMSYFAPRAYAVLNLTAGAYDLIPAKEVGLKIAPNPATAQVLIQTDAEFPISDMGLYDLQGRLLEQKTNVQHNQIRLERRSLPPGVYVVKLRIKDRIVAQKLVFN